MNEYELNNEDEIMNESVSHSFTAKHDTYVIARQF